MLYVFNQFVFAELIRDSDTEHVEQRDKGRVQKKVETQGGVMTIPSSNYFFFVWVLNDAKMH